MTEFAEIITQNTVIYKIYPQLLSAIGTLIVHSVSLLVLNHDLYERQTPILD